MRIAICDDLMEDRRATAAALDEYLKARGVSAAVHEFTQPETLLEAARCEPFDLYLLDVLLDDGLTGIDLIRRLQPNGSKIPVVFFSTSREYAVDAYSVEAISYLQKPWNKESFTHVMDLAMERCRKWIDSLLTFRTGSGDVRFAASEIESVETASTMNHVTIVRVNGSEITVRGSVRDFADEYRAQVRLVPAGRSLLVNPVHVATLEETSVRFFSGRSLAVPRSAFGLLSREILSLSMP